MRLHHFRPLPACWKAGVPDTASPRERIPRGPDLARVLREMVNHVQKLGK